MDYKMISVHIFLGSALTCTTLGACNLRLVLFYNLYDMKLWYRHQQLLAFYTDYHCDYSVIQTFLELLFYLGQKKKFIHYDKIKFL